MSKKIDEEAERIYTILRDNLQSELRKIHENYKIDDLFSIHDLVIMNLLNSALIASVGSCEDDSQPKKLSHFKYFINKLLDDLPESIKNHPLQMAH